MDNKENERDLFLQFTKFVSFSATIAIAVGAVVYILYYLIK